MYAVATFRRPLLDEPVVEKPGPRSGSASPRVAEALSVDTSLDALLDDANAMPTPGEQRTKSDSILLEDAPLPVSPTATKIEEEEIIETANDGKIEISCPDCSQSLRIPSSYEGSVRCPSCKTIFKSTDSEV